jgi:hypothetical protein
VVDAPVNRPPWDAEWVGHDEGAQQDSRMLHDKLGMEIEMDPGGMRDRPDSIVARTMCGLQIQASLC